MFFRLLQLCLPQSEHLSREPGSRHLFDLFCRLLPESCAIAPGSVQLFSLVKKRIAPFLLYFEQIWHRQCPVALCALDTLLNRSQSELIRCCVYDDGLPAWLDSCKEHYSL